MTTSAVIDVVEQKEEEPGTLVSTSEVKLTALDVPDTQKDLIEDVASKQVLEQSVDFTAAVDTVAVTQELDWHTPKANYRVQGERYIYTSLVAPSGQHEHYCITESGRIGHHNPVSKTTDFLTTREQAPLAIQEKVNDLENKGYLKERTPDRYSYKEESAFASKSELRYQLAVGAYHMGMGLHQQKEQAQGAVNGNANAYLNNSNLLPAASILERLSQRKVAFSALPTTEQVILSSVGLIESPEYLRNNLTSAFENSKTLKASALLLRTLAQESGAVEGTYVEILHGAANSNERVISDADLVAFANPDKNASGDRSERQKNALDSLSEDLALAHVKIDIPTLCENSETLKSFTEDIDSLAYELKLIGKEQGSATFQVLNKTQMEANSEGDESFALEKSITISISDLQNGKAGIEVLLAEAKEALSESKIYESRKYMNDNLEQVVEQQDLAKLVQVTQRLTKDHLRLGHEVRIATAVAAIVQESVSNDGLKETKNYDSVKMPLLHSLEDINTVYPRYIASLQKEDPKLVVQFVRCLADEILSARAEFSKRTLLNKESNVVALFHSEDRFDPEDFSKIVQRYGVEEDKILSLKGVPEDSSMDTKAQFLSAVRDASANRDEQSVIYYHLHGGEKTFEYSYDAATKKSQQITVREFADAIVQGQLAEGYTSIRLDHLDILMLACNQYNFSVNLEKQLYVDAIRNAATDHGVTVEQAPTIVTASQRGMLSFSNVTSLAEETFHGPGLLLALAERPAKEKLTFGDVFEIDQEFASKMAADVNKWESDSQGYGQHVVQNDLAVFGGALEVSVLLEKISERLRSEEGVELPEPERVRSYGERFRELSSLEMDRSMQLVYS